MEPGVSRQAITDAERFGAQPVLNENGVTVLRWHPPPGRRRSTTTVEHWWIAQSLDEFSNLFGEPIRLSLPSTLAPGGG